MTLHEAAALLRERANGTIGGEELRAIVRVLYGKSSEAEVGRFLAEARYLRIGRTSGGRTELEPAYRNRLRRDFNGPLPLDGIDLAVGPDVVAVEEDGERWFIAPQGAVMRLNHWLREYTTEPPDTGPEAEKDAPI